MVDQVRAAKCRSSRITKQDLLEAISYHEEKIKELDDLYTKLFRLDVEDDDEIEKSYEAIYGWGGQDWNR